MPNKRISQLPLGVLTSNSIFPIVASGITSQINFSQILSLVDANDVYVTGGTYSNGTTTFTNTTGGTFSVTGYFTNDIYVTGGTYNNTNGTTTFRNNTGGTFTVTGYITGYTYTPENQAYKQDSMNLDGTGIKYPTVDAVNELANNLARATINTGFIDTTDSFVMSMTDSTHLHITASDNGIIFKSLLEIPPFVPSSAIIQVPDTTIDLTALSLSGLSISGDGVYIRFIGYTDAEQFTYSESTFKGSHTTCQLGLLVLKVSGGTLSFLDSTRNVINIPSICAYSNLELAMLGLDSNVSVRPNSGTMTVNNTNGSIKGISVNWHGANNEEKPIASSSATSFTHLSRGNAIVPVPPAFTTAVTTDQYWDDNLQMLVNLSATTSASVQRWIVTINGTIALQYGEQEYVDLDTARNNAGIASFQDVLPVDTYVEIARMVAISGCTDLGDTTQALFIVTAGGGSGGETNATVWGGINGNINDQTDLQDELDRITFFITGTTDSSIIQKNNNNVAGYYAFSAYSEYYDIVVPNISDLTPFFTNGTVVFNQDLLQYSSVTYNSPDFIINLSETYGPVPEFAYPTTITPLTYSAMTNAGLDVIVSATTYSEFDDDFFSVDLPSGYVFNLFGLPFGSVYPTSNGYLTVGGGSTNCCDTWPDNISNLGVNGGIFLSIDSTDGTLYTLYTGLINSGDNFVIRVEGGYLGAGNQDLNNPDLIYNFIFYLNDPNRVDLIIDSNPLPNTDNTDSGISNGSDTFTGIFDGSSNNAYSIVTGVPGLIAQKIYSNVADLNDLTNPLATILIGENSVVVGNSSKALGDNTIVLGSNINGSRNNTTYVDKLNLTPTTTGTATNNLAIDDNGNVIPSQFISYVTGYQLEKQVGNAITIGLGKGRLLLTNGSDIVIGTGGVDFNSSSIDNPFFQFQASILLPNGEAKYIALGGVSNATTGALNGVYSDNRFNNFISSVWTGDTGEYSYYAYFIGQNTGLYSVAEGWYSQANGEASHAEGHQSTANNDSAHAEGYATTANGLYSHSECYHAVTYGTASHAEGYFSTTYGHSSHAEGNSTTADGFASHSQGQNTYAGGNYSHAGGLNTQANGTGSFVHGSSSFANNTNTIVLGANITGNLADTTYVDNLNIKTLGAGTSVNSLGVDINGNVVVGSGGAGSPYVIGYDNESQLGNVVVVGKSTGTMTLTNGSNAIIFNGNIGGFVFSYQVAVILGGGSLRYINLSDFTGPTGTIGTVYADNQNASSLGSVWPDSTGDYEFYYYFIPMATGQFSFAVGNSTKASGDYSSAQGYFSRASGAYSHAEGSNARATGQTSHAEGANTIAGGNYSHAEGSQTEARGTYSHAEGIGTIATNNASHAEGWFTTASGQYSHSQGNNTTAGGNYSHAGGLNSFANSDYSFVHGNSSFANNSSTIVLGSNISGNLANTTYVDHLNIKTLFAGTLVSSLGVDSSGNVIAVAGGSSLWFAGAGTGSIKVNQSFTSADGTGAISMGQSTIAGGAFSVAQGDSCVASGVASHAEGRISKALGDYSHAEGRITTANGHYSHSEGNVTYGYGVASHSEGQNTYAYGFTAHAEGSGSTAFGESAHAEGSYTSGGYNGYPATVAGNQVRINLNNNLTNEFKGNKIIINNLVYPFSSTSLTLPLFNINLTQPLITGTSLQNIASALTQSYTATTNAGLTVFNTLAGGNIDDGNIRVTLPPTFSTTWLGTAFTTVYIGTNGYLTFGTGSNGSIVQASQTVGVGNGGIFLSSAGGDNYLCNLYTGLTNGGNTFIIRYEGNTYNNRFNCPSGGFVFNFSFYKAFPNFIDLYIDANTQIGSPFTGGIADGLVSNFLMTFNGITRSAFRIGTDRGVFPNFFNALVADTTNLNSVYSSVATGGTYSHTEGVKTLALGTASHAGGSATTAIGHFSYAEGILTIASGITAHAEGSGTTAIGDYSHAEGWATIASGQYSHAEGNASIATGDTSHAEGFQTQALGIYTHSEGNATQATTDSAHAQNYQTRATGSYSHAEGWATSATSTASHAEGVQTLASGGPAHAEGWGTSATTLYAHAEGFNTLVSGQAGHAEGRSNRVTGNYSHAEGDNNLVNAIGAHVGGTGSTATGNYSFVHGSGSTASAGAVNSIILGSNILAFGANRTYVNDMVNKRTMGIPTASTHTTLGEDGSFTFSGSTFYWRDGTTWYKLTGATGSW